MNTVLVALVVAAAALMAMRLITPQALAAIRVRIQRRKK
jgi:hypothetical protein